MSIFGKTRIEPVPYEHDRKSGRFVIPGATISLKKGAGGHGKDELAIERSPVIDISKGGVAFLTNEIPKLGRVTLLLTYAEDEAPLRLMGTIVYFVSRGAGLRYRYRVGAEFAPFSTTKGHNSFESLVKLEGLGKAYGEKDPQPSP